MGERLVAYCAVRHLVKSLRCNDLTQFFPVAFCGEFRTLPEGFKCFVYNG